MNQTQVSKTAEYMALFRALESARPANVRLFDDPFALEFLRPSLKVVAGLARVPLMRLLIDWYIDRRWPGGRSSGIARTRLIDDLLLQALQQGMEQVVILGAGYDCRAYRLPGLATLRVFEVDHPATLAAKRQHLECVLGTLPQQVRFVAIDFNQQSLAEVLEAAGFDATRRVFFLWEGVTNYLTAQAVDATLRYMASAAPGSQIVFTYIHQGILEGTFPFVGAEQITLLLQRAEEPWTFGLDPQTLPTYLEARGLQLVADVGSLDYRARCMAPQGRHMRGYEFYRIAQAQVPGVPGKHDAGAVSARSTTTTAS
jgi:methyltransferase (TIGR00027 family)